MPLEETPDADLSSFEKGIKRRLSKERKIIEGLMAEYVVGVNSKWHSDNFPSTQLTKVVLNITRRGKKDFSSTHRLIREILKDWEKLDYTEYVTTTKYAHCRKTKMIYYFPANGLKKLKELIIDRHIEIIKDWDKWESYVRGDNVMQTRDTTAKLIIFEYTNKIRENIEKVS